MLDMNCDSKICENDIFTFLELHREDSFFKTALIYDLQDIIAAFKVRNEQLMRQDDVFDYTDESSPKMKDLGKYIAIEKERELARKDVLNQDLYMSTLIQHPPLIIDPKEKKRMQTLDPSDFFVTLGNEYEDTFKKILGKDQPKTKVVLQKKGEQVDVNKALRGQGLLE